MNILHQKTVLKLLYYYKKSAIGFIKRSIMRHFFLINESGQQIEPNTKKTA
jgi:hypothetical protein